ncbi:NACHT domain-containing protein [Stenotrophomonas sp. C2852]|uniref:NACHT domain-containing protein n=1 Tax=Stenotrophomonas sp. C2852 TaxID=3077845 RepID=UPI00293D1294|nr:NACHT domain-containing protein [Stenotrophomonas sp. C2852]MDV3435288.1 NACHT domain-containing protein [Stenotrophomonas sp. C2852]
MDYQDELVKAVLSVSAKEAVSRLVKKLGGRAKAEVDQELVQSRLALYASRLLHVKTLLAPENLTSLSQFYCVPRVSGPLYKNRPKSVDDFKHDHILIEGVAGQGKSMLLRQLCATAILEEGKIGLFVELRRSDKSKPLASAILQDLRNFGLPGNTEGLKALSVGRDVVVFLDGFDELDQKMAEKIDRDIAYITSTFPYVRLFVTCRPHVGLAGSPDLQVCKIERLNHQDVRQLVAKLCGDDSLSGSLNVALAAHKGNALKLLETPLLVTLLVAQYRQTQQLPEQLAEFYDNIFPVLFERHDSFKTPFVRYRRMGLTTLSYRKVFQKFCFASMFAGELTVDRALKLSDWALERAGVRGDSQDFLLDVADTSSLVSLEGKCWHFIHTSIQEYYAASHLLAGDDVELSEGASRLMKAEAPASVAQVFRFVSEINEDRFWKFVELPRRRRLCDPLSSTSILTPEAMSEWLIVRLSSVSWDSNKIEGFRSMALRINDDEIDLIRLLVPTSNDLCLWADLDLRRSDVLGRVSTEEPMKSRLRKELTSRIQGIQMLLRESEERVSLIKTSESESLNFLEGLLGGAK